MAGDVLVLGYHGVSEGWREPTSVSPQALESSVRSLLRRGWVGTTFTRSLLDPPAPRSLVVTFDDACGSVLDRAYPVLERLGVPGTVFVPTDFADDGALMTFGGLGRWATTQWADELRCLDWQQLGRLQAAGWEVGSHTKTHPRLSALDDEALAREVVESKARCGEALGVDCTSFAYPFSDVDRRIVDAVEQAGYLVAASVEVGFRRPMTALYDWPRVGIYRADGRLRFSAKTSSAIRRARHHVAEIRGRRLGS